LLSCINARQSAVSARRPGTDPTPFPPIVTRRQPIRGQSVPAASRIIRIARTAEPARSPSPTTSCQIAWMAQALRRTIFPFPDCHRHPGVRRLRRPEPRARSDTPFLRFGRNRVRLRSEYGGKRCVRSKTRDFRSLRRAGAVGDQSSPNTVGANVSTT